MQGHIRRRGPRSYEYIVDVGTAAAQRCQGCGSSFWVERQAKESCPSCGGRLIETEERRRYQGRLCHPEGVPGGHGQGAEAPSRGLRRDDQGDRREYQQKERLPADPRHDQADDVQKLRATRRVHIAPHIGSVKPRGSPGRRSSPDAKLAQRQGRTAAAASRRPPSGTRTRSGIVL